STSRDNAKEMPMWRRWMFALALAVSLPALAPALAQAQSWPSKPVRIIVPVTAGSATDVTARLIAAHLSQQLGQPFVVENRTGACGAAARLACERLRLAAGFEAQQIPFRGAPEAINEVLAQRVDFFFSPTLAAVPLVRDGKLVALAVSSTKRALSLPEVPTTVEAGYPNSDYNFWIGMWV